MYFMCVFRSFSCLLVLCCSFCSLCVFVGRGGVWWVGGFCIGVFVFFEVIEC